MTIDELRTVREANPFRPFIIHMADGRSYPVPHRDFISQSPGGGRTIIVYRADTSFSILDLYLVNELEIPAPATPSAPGANGE